MIYTSGSTGKPKGVAVEHAAAVDFTRVIIEHRGVGPGDRVLLFTSLGFDASVECLFPTLCAGATVVLRGETFLSPSDFLRFLEDKGVTMTLLPTAYWHELSAALAPLGETLPERLRLVVVGGEALRAESLALWKPSAARTRLENAYGPTEIVVECASYEVPADAALAGPVPIGRAHDGAELHILDADGLEAPDGDEGELYVGGRRIARGYLNRPELTAERFLPDPFSSRPGARMYRTGDQVRRRPDGLLEFRGRLDEQIKIRGYRVELAEVEAALAAHPAVGTCAVVLREEHAVHRLVAYVAPRAGSTVPAAALRAHLRETLPEYMVPASVMMLPSLPMTPNGKVDRRALPAPPQPHKRTLDDDESPRGKIRRIWEELLGTAPIGPLDNFFDLGGHSLMAMTMLARVEAALGARPSVSAFAQQPTIEQLAATTIRREAPGEGPEMFRLGPASGAEPFFFLHGDYNGGGFYCRRLLQAMPDRPLYVLPPMAMAETGEVPSVEELAGRYLEVVRAARPRGPYRLGGYCIGGTVAYEMARQLAASGEHVTELLLVASPVDLFWWILLRRACGHAGRLLRRDQAAMLTLFNIGRKGGPLLAGLLKPGGTERLFAAFRRVKREASIARIASYTGEAGGIQTSLRWLWAWAGYRPGPYCGPVTLLDAKDSFTSGNPSSELRRRAVAAKRVFLPGDHHTIVTTHIGTLSEEIARRLADASPASPVSACPEAV